MIQRPVLLSWRMETRGAEREEGESPLVLQILTVLSREVETRRPEPSGLKKAPWHDCACPPAMTGLAALALLDGSAPRSHLMFLLLPEEEEEEAEPRRSFLRSKTWIEPSDADAAKRFPPPEQSIESVLIFFSCSEKAATTHLGRAELGRGGGAAAEEEPSPPPPEAAEAEAEEAAVAAAETAAAAPALGSNSSASPP